MMVHTRYRCAGLQHGDKLVRDGFFEVKLLLQDRVRMGRIPHPNPINRQRRIPLLGRIIHRRILIPIVSIRIPQSKPIKVIFRNPGHEKLNHITTIRNCDLRFAITRCNDAGEGRRDGGERCACVADDGLKEGGDGGRVAVIEICGDGEDFIGGGGSEGDSEVCAVWICGDERCSEEGREDENDFAERLPDGINGVGGRHPDYNRVSTNQR